MRRVLLVEAHRGVVGAGAAGRVLRPVRRTWPVILREPFFREGYSVGGGAGRPGIGVVVREIAG